MSDADPQFPQDLLDLERARVQARLDLDLYVATVEVERRALLPEEDQLVERRTWPQEQTDRWHELRDAYQQAATAVREHRLLTQAAADNRLWHVEGPLRTAVPQAQVVVRRDEKGHEVVRVLLDGVEQNLLDA